ncbi:MAG: ABC transporter ATP-binding protein [Wenzhouxiangellaceae bacterium]
MTLPLQLEDISIAYGDKLVVDQLSFHLQPGEIGCLVGPSGCGKTSILRTIAGFERPRSGQLHIAGRLIASARHWVPPEQRRVGMVFQDFALFPHLDVTGNIAFGLRHLSSRDQQQRCAELLALMELSSLAHSYPHQLSGGQQQRVALARALAPRPDLLLLDEPFSSIDADLREQLAMQVRDVLKAESVAAILVTHDLQEAFAIGQRIGVIHSSRLRQWAEPEMVYHQPADIQVAEFVGRSSLLRGQPLGQQRVATALGELPCRPAADQAAVAESVQVLIRPHQLAISEDSGITAIILEQYFRGAAHHYRLRLQNDEIVLAEIRDRQPLQPGATVRLRFAGDHVLIY